MNEITKILHPHQGRLDAGAPSLSTTPISLVRSTTTPMSTVSPTGKGLSAEGVTIVASAERLQTACDDLPAIIDSIDDEVSENNPQSNGKFSSQI